MSRFSRSLLGFESVLVVLVPVQLTELIVPSRRNHPWLKQSGLLVSSIVFLIGSFIAWFLWIKIARAKVLHVPPYQPPFLAIFSGIVLIVILAIAACALRNVGNRYAVRASTTVPSPWIAGIVTLLFGFPWYALMALIFGPRRDLPLWIPVLAAAFWACLAYVVAHWFTSSPVWSDLHRWSAVSCATLVCMIAGFLGSSAWSLTDIVAKAILNVLAVAGFIWLALKISRRAPATVRCHSS